MTWWGHSTVWLADSGVTLLTDPVLTDRVAHLRRMAGPTPVLPGAPDAVLLSHLHADHFHLASLRLLSGAPALIVPRGAKAFVAKTLGPGPASRCVELAPGEETAVGPVRVRAVRAAHDGGRGPWSRERALAIGFVVEGAARTWYAGDTGLFDEMNDIGARLGPFDLTLIESGQYDADWPDWHLGPEQAVLAHQRVRGQLMMPVHWGLFALAHHGWTEPVERVLAAAACQHVSVLTPQPGQSVEPQQQASASRWWPAQPWHTAAERPVIATKRGDAAQRVELPRCS